MGNSCECVSRQTDDAEDALLSPDFDGEQPRGPPPPYQPRAPIYAYAQMTDEQRIQLVQRLTLIQCLPCGRYADTKEEKRSLDLDPDTCTSSSGHGGEKKGDKDRECPICMLDFVVGQPIRLLPCMHYYHMRCIDDWLMRSLTCPTCMERVDIGVRNTVLSSSHGNLRRRRVGSSSSTISTVSSSSSSSAEQLLSYPQMPPAESGGRGSRFGHQQGTQIQLNTSSPGQRNQNRNETQRRAHSHSPMHSSTSPLTLNLNQVDISTVSPPGSPLQASGGPGGSRGRGGRGRDLIPPHSPPLIEYHYEYLPTPTHGTKS